MLEGIELEGAAQLAIDAHQQVEIEFGGDAGLVAIGGIENFRRLDQIGADNQRRALAQDAAGIAQKRASLMRLEIADGGARKKSNPRRRVLGFVRKLEWKTNIGGEGQHFEAGEIRPQLGRFL